MGRLTTSDDEVEWLHSIQTNASDNPTREEALNGYWKAIYLEIQTLTQQVKLTMRLTQSIQPKDLGFQVEEVLFPKEVDVLDSLVTNASTALTLD